MSLKKKICPQKFQTQKEYVLYDFIYLEFGKKRVKANGHHIKDISCCHLRTLKFQTGSPTKKQRSEFHHTSHQQHWMLENNEAITSKLKEKLILNLCVVLKATSISNESK